MNADFRGFFLKMQFKIRVNPENPRPKILLGQVASCT